MESLDGASQTLWLMSLLFDALSGIDVALFVVKGTVVSCFQNYLEVPCY